MALLLFLGKLGALAGSGEQQVSLPAGISDVEALRDWLADGQASLGTELRAPGVRVAVNRQLIIGRAPIGDTDEIAFLPPMSGG
ncbi:MAG: MoaD/ThiS family protein [Sphingomicrobium sp.]